VKIIQIFFGKYLFYQHYLIIGADIFVSINCFGNMEPQMNADAKSLCGA